MTGEVRLLVDALRAAGGDSTDIEVTLAAGGLPDSLIPTLSAFANQPGGGTVVLGLDERAGFRPVRLDDPQKLTQGLADRARTAFTLALSDAVVEGMPVIVARVHECDPSAKPCRVNATGRAYLHGYGGDYSLAPLEEQAFLAARQGPQFDRAPVDGATVDDLDTELVDAYLEAVRRRDPMGLGRFRDDSELLTRACVTAEGGQPTVAGLLALGVHPQQWFPRYVIQAAADPLVSDPPARVSGTRPRSPAPSPGCSTPRCHGQGRASKHRSSPTWTAMFEASPSSVWAAISSPLPAMPGSSRSVSMSVYPGPARA